MATLQASVPKCPVFSTVWLIGINFLYFLVGLLLIGASAAPAASWAGDLRSLFDVCVWCCCSFVMLRLGCRIE